MNMDSVQRIQAGEGHLCYSSTVGLPRVSPELFQSLPKDSPELSQSLLRDSAELSQNLPRDSPELSQNLARALVSKTPQSSSIQMKTVLAMGFSLINRVSIMLKKMYLMVRCQKKIRVKNVLDGTLPENLLFLIER